MNNNIFQKSSYTDFYNSIDNDNKCMICLTNYNSYNKVILDCNHVYCNICIDLLLKKREYFKCPYCESNQYKIFLSKPCNYVTKNGKKCDKDCLTQSGICIFHNKYMPNNTCLNVAYINQWKIICIVKYILNL